MAKKGERPEDLNPINQDIENKIKQMLDPRLPDSTDKKEPVAAKTKPAGLKVISDSEPKKSANQKITTKSNNEAVSPKTTKTKDNTAKQQSIEVTNKIKTAPELPNSNDNETAKPPSAKTSRKVVVPVSHDESEDSSDGQVEKTVQQPTKITVNDQESSDTVAKKLDESIDELKQKEADDKKDTSDEVSSQVRESDADVETEAEDNEEKTDTLQTETEPSTKSSKSYDDKSAQKINVKTPPTKDKPEPELIDNEATDKAVKDIIAKEGDKLLESTTASKKSKKTKPQKLSFLRILTGKWLRRLIVIIVLTVLGVITVIPSYRYLLLNKLGVTASSSVRIVDTTTGLPLENVIISVGSSESTTDESGQATLTGLRLGKAVLKIERIAYETAEEPLTIGWGSNPLGERRLQPTGIQYKIQVNDYLSGKGIAGVRANSGDAAAVSDGDGLVTLTLPEAKDKTITISISRLGYRLEELTIPKETTEPPVVKLVAENKHIFVNRRNNKLNIYSVFADGKEEELILEASGFEEDDMALLPSYENNRIAYVSTRANNRNDQGNLNYNLLIVNLEDNSTTNVVAADTIQLVGWSGDFVVYVTTDTSDETANRSRLIAYNIKTAEQKELAKSNYFNDLNFAGGLVYFAPSSIVGGGEEARLFSIKADGSNQKTVVNNEVWKIFRNSYNELALSAQNKWYKHRVGTAVSNEVEDTSSNRVDYGYVDNPSNTLSAWVDGKNSPAKLTIFDINAKKDKVLTSKAGLAYPVSWLNDTTLVFRVESAGLATDYVISSQGGEPKKLVEVTKTDNIDNWYVY